ARRFGSVSFNLHGRLQSWCSQPHSARAPVAIHLPMGSLAVRRDSRIAVNHGFILHQTYATRKPLKINGLVLDFPVGTLISERPPDSSEQAQFGHSAPTLGV